MLSNVLDLVNEVDPTQQNAVYNDLSPVKYVFDYISDPKHVWDQNKYVSHNVTGITENGLKADFNLQYCLGAAFVEGKIGNMFFKMFYRDNQGYQIYVGESKAEVDSLGRTTFSAPYHGKDDAIDYLVNTSAKW